MSCYTVITNANILGKSDENYVFIIESMGLEHRGKVWVKRGKVGHGQNRTWRKESLKRGVEGKDKAAQDRILGNVASKGQMGEGG